MCILETGACMVSHRPRKERCLEEGVRNRSDPARRSGKIRMEACPLANCGKHLKGLQEGKVEGREGP